MTSKKHSAAAWAAVIVFIASVAVLAAAAERLGRPTARGIRRQLLAELRPMALRNCTLQRFGSAYDGGYLMCGNLLGNIESGYSYGIGPMDDWGCEVSTRFRVPVHQYDCFDPGRPQCPTGRTMFHDECIGAEAAVIDKRPFDTLSNHIVRNGDAGKTLVVKIDVEGAELDSLLTTSDAVLQRIDQLAMEIHGTTLPYLRLVRKLKRTFYPVHLHFNNQACGLQYRPMPAWAYQVLFVNKRLAVRDPGQPPPVLPHPLDTPDYPQGHDCQEIEW